MGSRFCRWKLALVIAAMPGGVVAEEKPSNWHERAVEALKAHCAELWPKNEWMEGNCIDKQVAAVKELAEVSAVFKDNSEVVDAIQVCADKSKLGPDSYNYRKWLDCAYMQVMIHNSRKGE